MSVFFSYECEYAFFEAKHICLFIIVCTVLNESYGGSFHLFEFRRMMFGQERRVGRRPNKRRRQTEFGRGLCRVCYRRRVDGVCGCVQNAAAQGAVASEEGRGMLNATMFAVDIDEVMMCVDEAGMQLSDEGFVVLRESDVEEEEGDDDDDRLLDEEMEEDLDVEVKGGGVDGMLAVNNGVGGLVELPEKCKPVLQLMATVLFQNIVSYCSRRHDVCAYSKLELQNYNPCCE